MSKYEIDEETGEVLLNHSAISAEDVVDRLNDLEAKLAQARENLTQCEADRKFEQEKKDIAMKRVLELKQQLAKKEKAYQELLNSLKIKDLSNINFIQVNDDIVKFSESGVIYEYNKKDNTIYKIIDKSHQDKISFAVERLEKVKSFSISSENNGWCETHKDWLDIVEFIDNQIEQLTHQHKDKGGYDGNR